MDKYPMPNHNPNQQMGFSLIELLVASALGIIVLLAANSTYFSTFRLKQQVQTRVDYEQDVRVAANMLRGDARQLGNYNCMAAPTANQLNQDAMEGAFAESKNTQSISTILPTKFTSTSSITPASGSTPLVLVSASNNLANNILATGNDSCNNAITGNNTLRQVVYAVGTTTNSRLGLYRVIYTNGQNTPVSNAQLLIDNVLSMNQSFQYDNHTDAGCPKAKETTGVSESDWVAPNVASAVSALDFDNYTNPPILITTTLRTCPNGLNGNGNSCKDNQNPVIYEIKSMVRQGEVCAKQSLDD